MGVSVILDKLNLFKVVSGYPQFPCKIITQTKSGRNVV